MNIFQVPCSMPELTYIFHLILTLAQQGRHCSLSFIEKEVEAEKSKVICTNSEQAAVGSHPG